ncbi:MAG: XTP/dITP diphosphohydrolase, partial [Pseudohongiellaceae bacterium]
MTKSDQQSKDAGELWDAEDHRALAEQLGAERSASESEAMQRLSELVGVVFRLRDTGGCPWDRKQTLVSMASHLVEEASETADAVARGDDAHVAEELGDTLLNVLLMSRIAADEGRFDLSEVAQGIAEKLVRRHPHVFSEMSAADAESALASWNASKARERVGRTTSLLDEVP